VEDIAKNIQRVRERIARAASACGRSESAITLLAVTKTFPVTMISEAIGAGLVHLGENRVQEAEPKIRWFEGRTDLQWHLVGHLQSNKARPAAELFHAVHSVDSVKLAAKLSQACIETGKSLSVLIQVDLGEEPTKFGARRDLVRELASEIGRLPGLRLDGLMTIPPFFEDPDQTRPFFAELRQMRDRLESGSPGCLGKKHLSMGMSHDFEIAISEGATIVRIGTAIFGSR
jgi:PLP dependent protein